MVSGIFVEGRRQTIPFILASDCKHEEDQKIFQANLSIISQNRTIKSNKPNETQKQVKQIKTHQSQIMTF